MHPLAHALKTLAPLDMTRQLIGEGVKQMEDRGLNYIEDSACGIFTGPAAPFCAWAFNSPMGQYVNGKLSRSHWFSIVQTGSRTRQMNLYRVAQETSSMMLRMPTTQRRILRMNVSHANSITGGLLGGYKPLLNHDKYYLLFYYSIYLLF